MKKTKMIIAMVLAMAVTLAMVPGTAMAAGRATDKLTVHFSAGVPGAFDMVDETLTVTGNLAEKYFPEIKDGEPEGVSFADALVAAHIKKYGSDKVKSHLNITSGDWGASVGMQFGHKTCGLYYVNNKALTGTVSDPIGSYAEKGKEAYLYSGACDGDWDLIIGYFTKRNYKAIAGKKFAVAMKATVLDFDANGNTSDAIIPADKCKDVTWWEVNKKTGKFSKVKATGDKKGKGSITFNAPGIKYISATGKADSGWANNSIAGPIAKVTVGLDKTTVTKKTAGKKKATLKWKKVTGAKKYQVYRATKKKGKFKKVATLKKTGFTNKKLKSKKTYYYKVRAIAKVDGKEYKGAFSKVAKIKAK